MVYLICAETSFKVGRAKDPQARMKLLQEGNICKFALIGAIETDDDPKYERLLLDYFGKRSYRRGEWFFTKPVEDDLIVLRKLMKEKDLGGIIFFASASNFTYTDWHPVNGKERSVASAVIVTSGKKQRWEEAWI